MNEALELGKTALKGGYLDQAGQYYRQALRAPEVAAQGRYGLALVALKRGDIQQALREFQQVGDELDGDADFHVNYGTALRLNGQLQEAVHQFETALRIEEENALAWAGLGFCLVDSGETDKARRYLSRSLVIEPEQIDTKLALGGCYHKQGDVQGALHFYRQALHNTPESGQARYLLGQTLQECGRHHEAIRFLEPLLGNPQFDLGARINLIGCYMGRGEAQKVLDLLEELQAPAGTLDTLKAQGARALNMLGRNDEAVALCRQLIARSPGNAYAWSYLLDLVKGPLSEKEMAILEEQLQRAEHPVTRARFAFALAGARERMGDYAGQWEALREGNAQAAGQHHYDPRRADLMLNVTLGLGERADLERLAEAGNRELEPVFILGMARSGTTLVEQVLGSHSMVENAGESGILSYVLEEYIQEQGLKDYAELFEHIDPDVIALLATRFRTALRELGVEGHRFTEKSIDNMKMAGLLYALFPRARFVVMHRHPLDVTFGCFKQLFSYQAFSFTLEGCAHEYALYYRSALPYWREHLPVSLHEMRYEDLVSNQEQATRDLLEYLGLPWEQACLEFHRNERQVTTASLNQVRKGLFSGAAGRWERYGELLDPLREALRAEGVEV